jgi:hypothetical protein
LLRNEEVNEKASEEEDAVRGGRYGKAALLHDDRVAGPKLRPNENRFPASPIDSRIGG